MINAVFGKLYQAGIFISLLRPALRVLQICCMIPCSRYRIPRLVLYGKIYLKRREIQVGILDFDLSLSDFSKVFFIGQAVIG